MRTDGFEPIAAFLEEFWPERMQQLKATPRRQEGPLTLSYSTSVFVDAAPDEVFDCVVLPEMMVQWMGDRALLHAVAGGRFEVDINGMLFRGEFIEVERPRRLVVSWGQLGNAMLPPGASRVTFEFGVSATGRW